MQCVRVCFNSKKNRGGFLLEQRDQHTNHHPEEKRGAQHNNPRRCVAACVTAPKARRMLTRESPGIVRRAGVELKPDGSHPEMDRRADALVYEVFDSGLIGEGALHIVAAARERRGWLRLQGT